MKMKVVVFPVLVMIGGVAVSAETANFPVGPADETGRWDLARAADWGGTIPPSDAIVSITGRFDKVITASADVTFGNLRNGNTAKYDPNGDTTFDMTGYNPVRKLKFSGFSGYGQGAGRKHAYFKGGEWDFGNGQFAYGGDSGNYGDDRGYFISDGALVTNVSAVTLGYTAQEKLRMEVTGKSKFFCAGNFRFTNNKTKAGNENWLKVLEGSTVEFEGVLNWENSTSTWTNQKDGQFFYKDYVIVSGKGSSLKFKKSGSSNYNYFGGQGGSATIVSDGAEMRVSANSVLSNGASRNNLIRVESGASFTTDRLYGGWGTHGPGLQMNRVEVLEDASFTCNSYFYLGYANTAGNTLLISNGTFKTSYFEPTHHPDGKANECTNETVVLQGPKAVFSVRNAYTMFTAPHCEYRVELGARYCPNKSFGRTSGLADNHDETLRVRTGGMLTNVSITTAMESSGGLLDYATMNNRIIAEAGGIITGSYVTVQGSNCVLRVDDSTVTLGSLSIGYSDGYGGLSTNCQFQIAGTHPTNIVGGVSFRNGSMLCYELPESGYGEGVVPLVSAGGITFDAGSSLGLSGAKALYDRLIAEGKRGEYVLMENPSGSAFLSEGQIAAAQSQVKDYFKLTKRVRNGKNQLVLKGGMPLGLTLIVR